MGWKLLLSDPEARWPMTSRPFAQCINENSSAELVRAPNSADIVWGVTVARHLLAVFLGCLGLDLKYCIAKDNVTPRTVSPKPRLVVWRKNSPNVGHMQMIL